MLKRIEEPTLGELVRELMGELEADAKRVRRALLRKAELFPGIAKTLLERGADSAIRSFFHTARQASGEEREEKATKRKRTKASAKRKARKLVKMFWDRYTLFGHKLLGDATVKDLRTSVSKRRAMADGNNRAAAFEEDIMKRMALAPAGTHVRNFLHPRKIAELRAQYKIGKV